MRIKFRTYFWDKDKRNILGQSKRELTDNDLLELIEERYISGEYGIPINLNKENIIFEATIDSTII